MTEQECRDLSVLCQRLLKLQRRLNRLKNKI